MTDVNVSEILDDLTHYFKFMKKQGFEGTDCSKESLNRLKSWGRKKPVAEDSFKQLCSDIGSCRTCSHLTDPSYFLPEKHPKSSVMFITGFPVMDVNGMVMPFSYEAGSLFQKMSAAMKLPGKSIYITSALKCISEKEDLLSVHCRNCFSFLIREIMIVNPRIICVLGSLPAEVLLSTEKPLSELRGRFYSFQNIPVMPTYHPKDLIQDVSKKRPVWEDLKMVMARLGIDA